MTIEVEDFPLKHYCDDRECNNPANSKTRVMHVETKHYIYIQACDMHKTTLVDLATRQLEETYGDKKK